MSFFSLSLRLAEILDYEAYLAWREPFGGIRVAVPHEGVVEWGASLDPRHEVVDGGVGIGSGGEVAHGKLGLTFAENFHRRMNDEQKLIRTFVVGRTD